jgi:hypothetical protein
MPSDNSFEQARTLLSDPSVHLSVYIDHSGAHAILAYREPYGNPTARESLDVSYIGIWDQR